MDNEDIFMKELLDKHECKEKIELSEPSQRRVDNSFKSINERLERKKASKLCPECNKKRVVGFGIFAKNLLDKLESEIEYLKKKPEVKNG